MSYVSQYIQMALSKDQGLKAPDRQLAGQYFSVLDALWGIHDEPIEGIHRAWEAMCRMNPLLVALTEKRLFRFDELSAMPAPRYLLDDLAIYEAPLITVLYGKPGTGKSFAALHAAATIAAEGRPVIYAAGEGINSLYGRYAAWCEHYQKHPSALYLWTDALKFNQPDEIKAFREALSDRAIEPALLIVDTLARSLAGISENDAAAMSAFFEGAEKFAKEMNVGILFVHHTNKGGELLRGSTAIEGAADSIIRLQRVDNLLVAWNDQEHGGKNKHKPEMARTNFRLHALAEDRAVFIRSWDFDEATEPEQMRLEMDAQKVLEAIDSGDPEGVTVRQIEDVTLFAKSSIYRKLNALKRTDLVEALKSGRYIITDKGKQAIGYVNG